jgi:polygalacturonase
MKLRWVAVLAAFAASACANADSAANGVATTDAGDASSDQAADAGASIDAGDAGDDRTMDAGGVTSDGDASGNPTADADGPTSSGSVVAYPLVNLDINSNYTPSPTASSGISMTVGGVAVNIQDNLNVSQSRFAMSGSQPVVITVAGGVSSADVRPAAFGVRPTLSGHTISFTLDQPRNFAVDINGTIDRLLIFADPLEVNPPQQNDPDVYDVTSSPGVKSDGTVCTSAIQAALDHVSSSYPNKSVLYFPDGVYSTATLDIPSNVQVYLESGAALLADPNINDYSPVEPDYADQHNVSAMVLVRNASNVRIFGRGVIDAGGRNMYQSYGQMLMLETLYTSHANGLNLQDVMLTNSLLYQSHFQGSNDVTLTNVKFNNPEGGPPNNDDGFKVNASTNVTFDGGWISSRDDNMTFAACCGSTEATQSTSNVNVKNVVLDGSGTASADIRFAFTDYGNTVGGINVSNIYDIGRGRGETLLVAPAGTGYTYNVNWGGVTLSNWDIEESEPLVHFDVTANGTPVAISDFTMSGFTMAATGDNYVLGASGMTFDGVHFENIVVEGQTANWQTLGLRTNSFVTNIDVDGAPPKPDLALAATASTTSIRAGDAVATANDGDWSTFFKGATAPSFPQYVTLTWPSAQTFVGVTYVCDYCQGQGLSNWDVQVSSDGTTWNTVASSGPVTWSFDDGTRETRLVSFPATTAIALRLQINGANVAFGQYQIDEVAVTPP